MDFLYKLSISHHHLSKLIIYIKLYKQFLNLYNQFIVKMNETSLCCPLCDRDYELPRRTLKSLSDNDYAVLPRLLPCLHSLCQSCIFKQMDEYYAEDNFDNESKYNDDYSSNENDSKVSLRNEITSRVKGNWESLDKQSLSVALKRWNHIKASISCPICLEMFKANLPDNFPLDIVTLKKVAQVNTPIVLAYCDKCANSIPSTSWCSTCFTPLCQFHHTDHELSSSTSSHDIYTYSELLRDGKHVNYRLPSVQCPHCLGEECVLFCETCELLISSRALLTGIHDGHRVEEVSLLLNEKRVNVHATIGQSQSYINKIDNEEIKIRKMLKDLNKLEDTSIQEIESKFDEIYKIMEQRKKELINKTKENINKKRVYIEKNYEILTELGQDHRTIVNMGAELLKDTANSSYRKAQVCIIPLKKNENEVEVESKKEDEVIVKLTDLKPIEHEKATLNDIIRDESREGMYLVASSSILERKSDTLSDLTDNILHGVLPTVYNMKIEQIHFSQHDVDFIKNIIHTVGGFKVPLDENDKYSNEMEDDYSTYTLSEEVVESLIKSNKKIHFTIRLNNKDSKTNDNKENKLVLYVWQIDTVNKSQDISKLKPKQDTDVYEEEQEIIEIQRPKIIGKINLMENFSKDTHIKWKSVTYESTFENGITEFKLFRNL